MEVLEHLKNAVIQTKSPDLEKTSVNVASWQHASLYFTSYLQLFAKTWDNNPVPPIPTLYTWPPQSFYLFIKLETILKRCNFQTINEFKENMITHTNPRNAVQ